MVSIETLERHELSAAWPDMESGAFDELVESVAQNGLREPIVLFEGKILDGWHRFQACLASGQRPMFIQFGDFEAHGEDAAEYAIDENLHRRHLNKGQRATSLARVVKWRESGHRAGEDGSDGMTNAEAAAKAQVSPRTISKAKQLVSSGNDELIEDVTDGKKSLNDAVEEIAPPKTVEVDVPESPVQIDGDELSTDDQADAAAVAEFESQPDNIVKLPDRTEPERPAQPSKQALRDQLEDEEDLSYAVTVQRDQLLEEVERLRSVEADLNSKVAAQAASMTDQGVTITDLRSQVADLIGWRELVVDAVRRIGADTDSDTQGVAWDELVKLVDSLSTSAAA